MLLTGVRGRTGLEGAVAYFGTNIEESKRRPFPGWGANMENTIIVKLSMPVREAIYFLVSRAEEAVTRRGNPLSWRGRRAMRLASGCLAQDDEPGFSVIRLDPGDEFEATVLREALIMAYRRVMPAFPGPDIGITEEARALVNRLDDWLKTQIVDRLGALEVFPDTPTP